MVGAPLGKEGLELLPEDGLDEVRFECGHGACSFRSGSVENSPNDGASVPALHHDALPIDGSSKTASTSKGRATGWRATSWAPTPPAHWPWATATPGWRPFAWGQTTTPSGALRPERAISSPATTMTESSSTTAKAIGCLATSSAPRRTGP